ncbi:MAG: tRNA (adenosine(37)-N6)-threonylcarbamoyltransferase complex dimerization subunit type 1 TsaB [Oscillospiraceae bacterium]|jgi:tRNA threonylcarbamoyladenosine biosynthesis protein TsaB|nr:tRNA (adenosine(37)-N6)-threonylcarbamoyltransferase complex dimerization subunit type 1 TsaB [Oscillospiraceae bacterium]
MLILALESSAKPASVAVCQIIENPDTHHPELQLLGQYFQNNGFSHSKTLMIMTESLLKNLAISPSDIERVAVANGPGSFTGVRIGVSAAKGFAEGLDLPIYGVSTLESMAYQTPITDTLLCAVMDARRKQVYNALFEWENGKLKRLCDDRVISLEDLSVDLKKKSKSITIVGDGAVLTYDYLNSLDVCCTQAPDLIKYQTAYGVALVSLHKKPTTAKELEPIYLRPSQAEREKNV